MHCHCVEPHLKNVDAAPLFHTKQKKDIKNDTAVEARAMVEEPWVDRGGQ